MIRGRGSRQHKPEEPVMTVARVSEITSASAKSFDDAIAQGIKRASKTLKNVTGRTDGCGG
jgi:hypothetical protein